MAFKAPPSHSDSKAKVQALLLQQWGWWRGEYTYSGEGGCSDIPSLLETRFGCRGMPVVAVARVKPAGVCLEHTKGAPVVVEPPRDHKETLLFREKVIGPAFLGSLPGCEQK